MTHLGDITKINGAEIEAVSCITGGSPCQDLSVAGKRAGLAGARSGLFMEQIRVIKEMRQHERDTGRTNEFIRPRYMVWENVPGAFSSNKGEDFRAVLEETARIADGNADVPQPPNGKWANAGCIMGNGWSIAWRVHDAQFWGVPQRRRRISLVADFGGQSAPEILFERKGVPGDSAESGTAGERIAADAESGVGEAVAWYQNGSGECFVGSKAKTVQTNSNASGRGMQMLLQPQTYGFKLGNSEQARSIGLQAEMSPTLNAECGGNKPAVFDARVNGYIASTMTGDHQNRVTDYTAVVTYQNTTGPLMANSHPGSYSGQDAYSDMFPANGKSVRRLTPLECERLQGYPEIMEMNLEAMTKDEYIACNLASGQIIANCETGEVYTAKGPGGIALSNPRKLDGTNNNGYLVVNIRNGDTKLQCRIHRIIWISAHGIIPDGYVIDHINSIKTDNRLCNLQLLTCAENSHKAKADGLYLMGADNPSTKITQSEKTEIVCLYSSGLFTMRQLSEEYGISKSRIQQIVKTYGWTDIPGASDSARYKALGNSIALPFWRWMLNRMSTYLPADATLGSLFDGIGGFPLIWQEIHGKGTARWASEIEPFPIAVTKARFPSVARAMAEQWAGPAHPETITEREDT